MKPRVLAVATLLVAVTGMLCSRVEAQTYDTNNVVVQTFAGSGFSGYVDGQGTQTMFNGPYGVVSDSLSNLFVLDHANFRIRRITPDGTVSTFIGGGVSLQGKGTNVSLGNLARPMAIDRSDTLWLAEYIYSGGFSLVRAGSDGYVTITNLSVAYNSVGGMCADSGNNLYFSDESGNRIYRYRTNGALEVFAGSGNLGSIDGNGIFTSFSNPSALAADSADDIYVWDSGNHLIRRINQNRDVVTIAGNKNIPSDSDGVGFSATFNGVSSMCADNAGNIYLASFGYPGSAIRKMTAATNVTTLAGSFTQVGYINGSGSVARFDFSDEGICFAQGMVFVADAANQRIRNIAFNPAPQVVSAADLDLSTYAGLRIAGVIGRSYRIESSTDMSNWSTETTILLTATPYLWIDPSSLGQKKFYRAFLLP